MTILRETYQMPTFAKNKLPRLCQFSVLTTDGAGVAAILILDKEHQKLTVGGFSARIFFFIFLVLKKLVTFRVVKTKIFCVFTKLSDQSQGICVGGKLSNKSRISPNFARQVSFENYLMLTYDWAKLNFNWPC